MHKIKVAIVEDDPNWIDVMASFLNKQEDIEVAGTAKSRTEALELAKSVEFDVMLMDINLSGNKFDGIEVVSEILDIKKIKIIMLTSYNKEDTIKDSFAAGAVNYVLKEDFHEIPDVVRKCYKDGAPFEILLKEYKKLKRDEQLKDLSSSEKEIYLYLEKGYTYTQIQNILYKSHNTVKTQIRSILSKLNVKSYKEAIIKVKSCGVITGKEKKSE